jgi:hypothetical protein
MWLINVNLYSYLKFRSKIKTNKNEIRILKQKMAKMRNAYSILVQNPHDGDSGCRWLDNM